MTLTERIRILIETLPKRQRVFLGIIVFIVLVFMVSGGFSAAWSAMKSRAFERKIEAMERDVNAALASRDHFKAESEKFKTQNSLLKEQEEATAEILRANDKRLEGNAAKLNQLNEERKRKYEEIDNYVSSDVRRCILCDDYDRAGFRLSADFCGKCQRK